MVIFYLALRNLIRRGWHFRILIVILVISILCLLASLGALRGVQERIDLIDEANLRRVFRIGGGGSGLPLESELEKELLTMLAGEAGVVGVAEVTNAALHLRRPNEEPFYRLASINQDAAHLLSPRILDGIWLSEIEWSVWDDAVPVVASDRIGRVGDIINGYIHDLPVKARIIGTFDPNSYYFNMTTELLPRVRTSLFIPIQVLFQVPFLDQFPHLRKPWRFIIAESPEILEANKERWTQLLNEERERRGVPYEVRIITMDEWEGSYLRDRRDELVFILWITGIIVALTAFGYGSINAVSIWDRSVELGTHFATGATRSGVAKIVLFEMLLPLFIPLLVALAAWRWGNVWEVIVVDEVVVFQSLAVIGGIGVLSTLGPLLMVQRVKPATLIRGGYR